MVDRGLGTHRILYVAGRPNWEFKFLNRALTDDEQIQLVGLIRIAKREKKFEFVGRQGEQSNPLFRGSGLTNENTERYDQPVLVRRLCRGCGHAANLSLIVCKHTKSQMKWLSIRTLV